jgi:hypothetical protein
MKEILLNKNMNVIKKNFKILEKNQKEWMGILPVCEPHLLLPCKLTLKFFFWDPELLVLEYPVLSPFRLQVPDQEVHEEGFSTAKIT